MPILSGTPVVGEQPRYHDGRHLWCLETAAGFEARLLHAAVPDAQIIYTSRAEAMSWCAVASADPDFATKAAAVLGVRRAVADIYMGWRPSTVKQETRTPALYATGKPTAAQLEHQWWHSLVRAPSAWDQGLMGSGVRVVVPDSGVPCLMKFRTAAVQGQLRNDFGAEGNYLQGDGRIVAAAGETLTVRFQDNTPIDIVFATEATLEDIADTIDAAISAEGYSIVLTAPFAFTGYPARTDRHLVIGSKDTTAASRVRIVSGTGSILDKLGLSAGTSVLRDDAIVAGTLSFLTPRRLAYMKFAYPHPAFDTSLFDVDLDALEGPSFDALSKWVIQRGLYTGADSELAPFRTGASTGSSSGRTFTFAASAAAAEALANVGVQPGDLLYITGAARPFTVITVNYEEPTVSDVALSFVVDRDWGALASKTDLTWYVLPDPTDPYRYLTPFFDHTGHSTIVSSVIGSQHQSGGVKGMAPRATMLFKSIFWQETLSLLGVLSLIDDLLYRDDADVLSISGAVFLPVDYPAIPLLEGAFAALQYYGMAIFVSGGNESLDLGPPAAGAYYVFPQVSPSVYTVAGVGPATSTGYAAAGEDLEYDHPGAGYTTHVSYGNYGDVIDLCAPAGQGPQMIDGGAADAQKYRAFEQRDRYMWVHSSMRSIYDPYTTPAGWLTPATNFTIGVSLSAPVAAGACVLVLEALRRNNPAATGTDAAAVLLAALRDLGHPSQNYFGNGLVDLRAAVAAALGTIP